MPGKDKKSLRSRKRLSQRRSQKTYTKLAAPRKGNATYAAMEAATQAREWQDEAKRKKPRKPRLCTTKPSSALEKHVKTVTMRAESLATTEADLTLLERQEETQQDLNELYAQLCQTRTTQQEARTEPTRYHASQQSSTFERGKTCSELQQRPTSVHDAEVCSRYVLLGTTMQNPPGSATSAQHSRRIFSRASWCGGFFTRSTQSKNPSPCAFLFVRLHTQVTPSNICLLSHCSPMPPPVFFGRMTLASSSALYMFSSFCPVCWRRSPRLALFCCSLL